MSGALADKVAIVTGGASGLGYAMVERFVDEGARVVIADRDVERGSKLAAEYGDRTLFHEVDVAEAEQVRELVAATVRAFGGLHVMVNNAGVGGTIRKSLLHDDFGDFERVMRINVLGVMLGTREAAAHMAEHDGGSIVNVSSIGGIQAGPGVFAYRASKAAVVHFTTCAAIELAKSGIRVNCIAPGGIPTPLLASGTKSMPDEVAEKFIRSARQKMADSRHLEREGTPDDVARAAVYLAGDGAAYVTGTVLPVDGGTVAGPPVERRFATGKSRGADDRPATAGEQTTR